MHIASPRRRAAALGLVTVAAVALAGCTSAASPEDTAAPTTSEAAAEAGQRIAVTYDGGIAVLDAATLEQVADLPLAGFNRLNTAGDGQHVFVSTEGGFQVLSTGADGTEPELGETFAATTPGHVVRHGGRTVLFDDGTGDFWAFDTDALLSADGLPETTDFTSEAAHHGVAVELEDGSLLSTLGTSEGRTGVRVLDDHGHETARFEECPSVHGEAVAADEAVMFGCEDGVLTYVDGAFVKLTSPDEYGRVGNGYTTDDSAIAVTDYKDDPDAEGSLLHRLAFIDTAADNEGATLEVIDLPEGVEYTWRGVGRDAEGAAWFIGTDGSLHRIDVETREITESFPVIDPWEGPAEWQESHPGLVIADGFAYVNEPATSSVHRVDLSTGEVVATGEVPGAPNELAFAG